MNARRSSKRAEISSKSFRTKFSVPVERQQQIGVTYASAERRPIQLSIRSVGVLEPDQGKIFEYVARVDGYIQDLKVTSPGEQVNVGEPLVTIYSPDLRSSEQELVNLLNERDRGGSRASLDQVIESSKQRLRQWNVSDQEINALEKSRKAADTRTTVASAASCAARFAIVPAINRTCRCAWPRADPIIK